MELTPNAFASRLAECCTSTLEMSRTLSLRATRVAARRRLYYSREMLTRTVMLVAAVTSVCTAFASDDGYSLTLAEARTIVREHYRYECEEEKSKPRLPYRETFEEAMRGNTKALHTVFTDPNYHSGDNESWEGAAWALVHVAGDRRFSVFLDPLDPSTQRHVFETIFYSGSYHSRALKNGYFERTFPRVAAIYQRLHPPNASNRAMERTPKAFASRLADRCTFHF